MVSPQMLLAMTVCFAVHGPDGSAGLVTEKTALPANAGCPSDLVPAANPRDCCRSFLDLHKAIYECLPQPGGSAGAPCIAQCILQGYRGRPIVGGMPLSMSTIITVGPKLATHFEQCKDALFDFLMSSSFEGDFRRIVCDERLDKFLGCILQSWFTDCLGFDDVNQKCIDLRDQVQSTNCTLSTFFAKPNVA